MIAPKKKKNKNNHNMSMTWDQCWSKNTANVHSVSSSVKFHSQTCVKLENRTFFCSAARDFSSFLAWLCAHFKSSRVFVSWCSSCLNSSCLSSHNFANSSNFLQKTHNSLHTVQCAPHMYTCTVNTLPHRQCLIHIQGKSYNNLIIVTTNSSQLILGQLFM